MATRVWLLAVLLCSPVVARSAASQLPGVGAAMQGAIDAREIAGAVTVVVTKDKVLHLETTGLADVAGRKPMRPDSLFWIASMTKPVTAVAVLMLQDEGKLNVADPVAKYIPAFAELKTPSGKPANLTVTQILTHTSGLGEAPTAGTRNAKTLSDLIPLYLAAPMQYEPGTKWQYTQSGINVAAHIVEVVSGLSFDTFAQQRIFDPLGMKNTTFYPTQGTVVTGYAKNRTTGDLEPASPLTDFGVGTRGHPPLGNGGLYSTGPDYARFCQMLLAGGVLEGKHYLSTDAMRLLTTVQTGSLPCGFFQSAEYGDHGANYGWGIGTCILRTPHEGVAAMLSPGTFGHGGAWGTQAWIDPVRGVAYVLMVARSNFPNSDASGIRRAFQQAAADALAQTGGPDFGPNVLVFDPCMPMADIQQKLTEIQTKQQRAQFGPDRYAILFKPGKYELDVQIAYYMHLMGLGRSPDDVQITGAVRSRSTRGALVNFWRAVENFSVIPTVDANHVNTWAVSQAATMRRAHIKGNLNLWENGYSSGGYLADCKIDGTVTSGTQQQWFSRNDEWGAWSGGNWNMVFVGVINPPAGEWPARPYTVVEKTPLVREKPYLMIDDAGKYFVFVPALRTTPTQGASWTSGPSAGTAMPIDQFYIAHADKDTAASINAALSQGRNLILTPGIYHVESPILVTRPNTAVLGLGLATLVPDKGTSAMMVSDVDGVLICSLLLDAGTTKSPTLLQVGEPGSRVSHAANPIFLYDIFGRAGGSQAGVADTMVVINSNNVVGDCFWLWRADHGNRGTVGWDINRNERGLVVNGNDVTMYGLFVEHCQEYQTLWNGNGGRVYFYQCEMPYDPPSTEVWRHDDVAGFAGYKVADTVQTHEAWGIGVYAFFRGTPILAENGIEAPKAPGIKMHHLFTIRLGGNASGAGIEHVVSGVGDPVINRLKATVDEYP
jgi:CubicO group peptidase (beta-lactamase class C family)